ncbi:hypothetical protein [Nocardioides sp. CF8]|uniref:hypothetical protein n=1 Tax=Nocardioides sp. CF8 TaxID=110319 RepID=UPI0012EBE48E|nr:hypothetical protein [Nocardioides sp. CF8]
MTSRVNCMVLGLALALALAGCASDRGETAPDPQTAPTTSGSAAETQTATESPTEVSTTAAVDPATGPRLAVRGLSVNAPAGWRATRPYAVMASAVPPGATETIASVYRFPNSGLFTVDELGDSYRSQGRAKFKLKRLEDVELDGQTSFHVAGKANPGEYFETFGSIVNDDHLLIFFEFHDGEDKATRDEIIASVLATVDYREVKQ